MVSNSTVFISGGCGFIGTALARRLMLRGNRVVVYDKLVRNSIKYFPEVSGHANFTFIEGDIRDREGLKKAIQGVDFVFHLAAIAGVSK